MILYAPIIDTRIPGFLATGPIKIHFTHNPAISKETITSMAVGIKAYGDSDTTFKYYNTNNIDWDTQIATLNAPNLTLGVYYQIKIAYQMKQGENTITGPYSALGVGRCAGNNKTKVGISPGGQCETYTGTYSNEDLTSEIVARYRLIFRQKDDPNTILEDSGWIEKSNLQYTPKLDLVDKTFNIELQVVTINGLELNATTTTAIESISPSISAEKSVSQDSLAIENGYVTISTSLPEGATIGYLKRKN